MKIIKIHIEKIVPAKKWRVFRLISRLHHYIQIMPNIKHCTLIERQGLKTLTLWSVEIDQIPIQWKEEEHLDLDNFLVRFKSIEGDLELFEGEWILTDHFSGGTQIDLHLRIKIGLPLIDQILGSVLRDKIQKNFQIMIDHISDRLTADSYHNIGDRKRSGLKGFAAIGHPYNFQHLIRILRHFKPELKTPNTDFLMRLYEITPSYISNRISNFQSKTGKTTNGYFIMCPIIPDMFNMGVAKDIIVKKVKDACRLAEDMGVGIVTLGGFTSIAGEKFEKTLGDAISVPVTTGNTFTVAMVLEGIRKAAHLMELDLRNAKVTIIGGTGDIGGACARLLSEVLQEITITGRNEKNLMEVQRILSYHGKAHIKISINNNEAIKNADIIIAAASVSSSMIDFNNFKPAAIICDVGYPKNISYTTCKRSDILIFSGGVCSIPSEFSLGFDHGMPNTHTLYGCFAEAIILDLEERYENFSAGKGNITKEKVQLILDLGKKHGFEVSSFFWGDRMLRDEEVQEIGKARV